jgi:hypothetical protein
MKGTADYLVFVEDPGAANCIAPVLVGLEQQGRTLAVVAVGLARESLTRRHLTRLLQEDSLTPSSLLDQCQPRVLIVGTAENPATPALDLVAEARRRAIATVGIVDAGMNAEMRFRGLGQSSVSHLPDWVVVPDEWTRDAFVRAGASRERTVVCGNAHADYVRQVARGFADRDRIALRRGRVPGAADGQKVVIFASEGSARRDPVGQYAHPFDGCTLRPEVTRTGRTEILLEAFLQVVQTIEPRPYVVLRVHPKDDVEDYRAFGGDLDQFDAEPDPLPLVLCADLVVGATSMLLQEAAWLGCPTLSIVPCDEQREWLPMARTGVTPTVTSMHQLRSLLPGLLQQGHRLARDAENEGSGSATERTLSLLNALATANVTGTVNHR